MKKILLMMAAMVLVSCEQAYTPNEAVYKFNLNGDFTLRTHDFTRALEADGKSMTDVWVFDYVDDALVQQVHQTSEDEDFGAPEMALCLGNHNLYFVASRGGSPTVNTTAKTIILGKVLDTFWKALSINVTSGGSENRAVTLDRVVTKLRLDFKDAVPQGTQTINITPEAWYYGFNYQTGAVTGMMEDETITVNVPSANIGTTGLLVSVFGFSPASEWTTDVIVDSKDSDDDIIGKVAIADAPFLRNRVTEYSGQLWNASGAMTISLNTTWEDSFLGTW